MNEKDVASRVVTTPLFTNLKKIDADSSVVISELERKHQKDLIRKYKRMEVIRNPPIRNVGTSIRPATL